LGPPAAAHRTAAKPLNVQNPNYDEVAS